LASITNNRIAKKALSLSKNSRPESVQNPNDDSVILPELNLKHKAREVYEMVGPNAHYTNKENSGINTDPPNKKAKAVEISHRRNALNSGPGHPSFNSAKKCLTSGADMSQRRGNNLRLSTKKRNIKNSVGS